MKEIIQRGTKNMYKRIMAGILSFLLLFSATSITSFANAYGFKEEFDYTTNDYVTNDEMFVLSKLGITSWENIEAMAERHNEPITRAFMAWYMVRMAKLPTETPSEYETMFKDLSSEYKYYSQIKSVVNAGYMNGDPDGYFRPNDLITPKEAATVLLRVLGYQQYISVAGVDRALKQTRILDGIALDETVTQEKLLMMFFNALNSPAIKSGSFTQYGNGEMDVEYLIDEAYLGFEHLYGIKHEIGILDAISSTTLDASGDMLNRDEIGISGITYKYDGDAGELLGYKVNYLYSEKNNGDREIFHLYKAEGNEELVLTQDVIEDFKRGVYSYEDGNKTKEIGLSKDTRVLFNGVANPGYSEEEMMPQFGSVTFINNDNDSDYEVVKVESIEFYICSKVDEANKKLYTETYDVVDILDISSADSYAFYSGETQIDFDRVKVGNLLAVRKSSPNSDYESVVIDVQKATKTKVEVTKIKENAVTIGNMDYKLWDNMPIDLEVGEIYNIYVYRDILVAVADGGVSELEHAYLINYGVDDTPFANNARIAAVDANSNYVEYDVAKILFIDGVKQTSLDAARTRLMNSAAYSRGKSDSTPLAQPVMLGFNGNGEVNKIETYADGDGNMDTSEDAPLYQYTTDTFTLTGMAEYNSINPSIHDTTNDRNVSNVPTTVKTLFIPAEDRFETDSYSTGAFLGNTSYKLDISNRNDGSGIPEAIYIYEDSATIDSRLKWVYPCLIAELYTELDAEGETKYMIRAYQQTSEVVLTCDKEMYDRLDIGDLWFFFIDKNSHVTRCTEANTVKISELETPGLLVNLSSYIRPEKRGVAAGTLLNVEGGFIKVCEAFPDENGNIDLTAMTEYYKTTNIQTFKYSVERGIPTLEKVNLASAVPYSIDPENPSKVVLVLRSGVRQMIIFE